MDPQISLDGIIASNQSIVYYREREQVAAFTTKVLALTPIPKDVLEAKDATCIMCDDREAFCVTASFGSGRVPTQFEACAKYFTNQIGSSWIPWYMIHKVDLRQDVDLTTFAAKVAKDVAYTTITQHRDDRLLMMLCRVVGKWGIIRQDPFKNTEHIPDSWARIEYEECFASQVRCKYPDSRKALQQLCPLALYTFDEDDALFDLPDSAYAGFLHDSQVMRFVNAIWPIIADDAWTSGLAMYEQDILDARRSHLQLA